MTKILNRSTNTIFEVDENQTLEDIKSNCVRFFKVKHGKRETFSVYRGCVIVRHTVQYTGQPPKRETVVYTYGKFDNCTNPDFFCVSIGSQCESIAQAKKLINCLLDCRVYYYGFYKG